MSIAFSLRVAFALLAVVAMAPPAGAGTAPKKLVCWTDAQGNRVCGDSVPPQYSNVEKQEMDAQGRVKRTLPAALTPEQRAAQEKAAADEAAARKQAQQQQASDRALLSAYSGPDEILQIRDDRLAGLDTSARFAQKAVDRDRATLTGLQARAPEGKPVDKKLADEIARAKTSLAGNERALDNIRKNRAAVCETFAQDVRRFQELKTGQATFDGTCPEPKVETSAR